jgi:hypothetical protein
MPSRGSVGFATSGGFGTSQFGGDQTLPAGLPALRSNWQDARAMLTPSEKNSASTTRMRKPSRTSFVLTSIGAKLWQAKHVDRQPRWNEFLCAMALLDLECEQADDDAAVQ